jgi:hypothetical protein
VRQHPREIAGIEFIQRRLGGVDLVAEHPQMSRVQPAIFIAFQAQRGQRRGGVGIGHGKHFGESGRAF